MYIYIYGQFLKKHLEMILVHIINSRIPIGCCPMVRSLHGIFRVCFRRASAAPDVWGNGSTTVNQFFQHTSVYP